MMGKLKIFWEKLKKMVWPFWGDDKSGSIAYFEDTGEEMGIVKKVIRDSNGKVAGYEIEDVKSKKILSMSRDSFEVTGRGLIFTPLWYSEAREFIEELEFKTKMPGLSDIISEGNLSKRELDEVVKANPELNKYLENADLFKKSLGKRLNDLEEKRIDVRKELMLISEKRLLDEIGRREFTQAVIGARRNAHILDLNIKRCRELLIRLESIPFIPKHISIPYMATQKSEEIMPLEELVNNIPINVMVINSDGKILSVNEQFMNNLLYNAEDIKGRELNEFVPDAGIIIKTFNGLSTHESGDVEFTFIDGESRERKMFGRSLNIKNGKEGINVLAFQEKLEESEEFRKIFAKEISHQFFNPLCIAQGYLYLLDEGKYGELTEGQRKQVKSISQSLKRIEKLVKETIKVSS
ncbi:MAG: histidine kinase dimerization/phospho-acceptor domain-containing protein [Candidatus Thermoplasmatota archaeon]|nr:histidine kinase dimerization/phospho-acceptor domain-containing protein [Candidatus Thermoplasmatota archaeon]